MRLHLFEFNDQSWLPAGIRQSGTAFLETVARITQIYRPTADILNQILNSMPDPQILVLGAGSGGGILDVRQHFPKTTRIVLTDLFPDSTFVSPSEQITYFPESVDALHVPRDLSGLRVMYTAFHHLKPALAKQLLADATNSHAPIAIFEATERSFKGILSVILVPFLVLGFMPFVRPFRWRHLLFTYLLPILPLLAFWDGLVSALRTYRPEELQHLVSDLTEHQWFTGILKGPHGENISTLVGLPKNMNANLVGLTSS